MPKVALYARYSSENQRDASIEDQLRLCRLHAEKQSWTIVDSYTDRAISGASLLRPGIQELIQDATRGRFEIVLAEAMDRLSRDQEDIAGLFKRMQFGGVRIVTLSEGDVTHLHIGLKGTMNALFLKDLADKVRRGLRGRVEHGKSGGGNAYGYDVVKKFAANGDPVRGDRTINEAESSIIRRIFEDYAGGKSPKRIATELNRDRIKAPSGGDWGFSTINGNLKRGNGILNNEMYIGRLVWNRQRFIKDPDTGKRVSRMNPQSEWITLDVPELRIIDQDLWDQAKARQRSVKADRETGDSNRLHERQRGKYLLTGLTKCGSCGGGYSMVSADLVGCSTARNKGTCDNRLNIRRNQLEARVLTALKDHLMNPELFAVFCDEFTRRMNERRIEASTNINAAQSEIPRIERDLERLVDRFLKDDGAADALHARMKQLEGRKRELQEFLASAETPPPVLHPSMAVIYRERVAALHEALQQDETRAQAAEVIRSLVSEIVLTPAGGLLEIDVGGDLAGILTIAAAGKQQKSPSLAGTGSDGSQVMMVAGTCKHVCYNFGPRRPPAAFGEVEDRHQLAA
ncbi:recombinase family protein [Acidiphilium iwatense]|uniref:Recombinase family protein n=1 Tax=Acidiphilium iwatense TaxID=768198 RepID=A0ABS9DYH8_9PROT|nr:recombinase family protein [Acidiphilium iwatense]MCF3947811.1 recombinase family protein [Acidiphilium iwatense]